MQRYFYATSINSWLHSPSTKLNWRTWIKLWTYRNTSHISSFHCVLFVSILAKTGYKKTRLNFYMWSSICLISTSTPTYNTVKHLYNMLSNTTRQRKVHEIDHIVNLLHTLLTWLSYRSEVPFVSILRKKGTTKLSCVCPSAMHIMLASDPHGMPGLPSIQLVYLADFLKTPLRAIHNLAWDSFLNELMCSCLKSYDNYFCFDYHSKDLIKSQIDNYHNSPTAVVHKKIVVWFDDSFSIKSSTNLWIMGS